MKGNLILCHFLLFVLINLAHGKKHMKENNYVYNEDYCIIIFFI